MRSFTTFAFACLLSWVAACESPTFQPFRRTISGTVREANGGPLAGVEVDGWPQDRESQGTVTAQDGSFRFNQTLYQGLWFGKPGYHPASWWLPPNELQQVNTVAVRMQPHIFMSSPPNLSSLIVPDDATFAGSYPFGDEGAGYECGPCKLIDIPAAERGATLRLSWSGSTPLALWAGDTHTWDGPYVRVVGRQDASELAGSTKSRIDAVLVGLDPRMRLSLDHPIAFTLTVNPF